MKCLVLLLCLTGCFKYTELDASMMKNAECACKHDGGVNYVAIKIENKWIGSKRIGYFNFHCKGGLSTSWWSTDGSMVKERECKK